VIIQTCGEPEMLHGKYRDLALGVSSPAPGARKSMSACSLRLSALSIGLGRNFASSAGSRLAAPWPWYGAAGVAGAAGSGFAGSAVLAGVLVLGGA
jgi:hypothetical protein